jgi:hypothetical protein
MLLEGMPANAIEKIEIITQPGAEFPATSGGLNIITNKNAKNYLSATSNSTSFTSYNGVRWRMNNSILLSAKTNIWMAKTLVRIRENAIWTSLEKENGMTSLQELMLIV